MNGFLYFVEGLSDVPDLEQAGELGIAYAFDAPPACTFVKSGHGPTGMDGRQLGGALLCASGAPEMGKDLVWTKCRNPRVATRGHSAAEPVGVYIGRRRESAIGPGELVREQVVMSHAVTLGDGKVWQIPIALKFMEDSYVNVLPHRMGRGADGRWGRTTVTPRYAGLCAAATAFFDWYMRGAGSGEKRGLIDDSTVAELAIEALAINYRLSADEVELLGLLDERSMVEAAKAVIDVPGLEEHVKKKDAVTA